MAPRRGRRIVTGFDFAVVGRGLMGSAAARYLAQTGAGVALIGPDEPADPARHDGPFASHHDAGRITRILAGDPDWSRLAARSIARYGEIAERAGVAFYHPVGTVMAGAASPAGDAFFDGVLSTAETEATPHARLSGAQCNERFPMLRFANGTRAAFDPSGGWIDPRAMRRAEERLAVMAGARIFRDVARSLKRGEVTMASGMTLTAGHVVVATGAYAGLDDVLARAPALDVHARTVAFVEMSEELVPAYASMPCVIHVPADAEHDLYVLPPIRYPDGRWRVKIGGEAASPRLTSPAEMTAWFRGGGDPAAGKALLRRLARLMPDLPMTRTATGACAVAFTRGGLPCIARVQDDVTVLTGGNGAAAKCADELGRLGALVAMHGVRGGGVPGDEGYATDFAIAV